MSESGLKVQVLEGADNKLNLAKLEDVLKRKLIIPSYQRPYAWKVEDIEEIFQTISNEEEIYFFGSIILSKKGNGNGYGQEKYYIIDGQQRLSSFLLILRVILDELERLSEIYNSKDLREARLKKSEQEKDKLSKIIKIVSLGRENPDLASDERTILNFIKNSGDYSSLNDQLKKKVKKISEKCSINHEDELTSPSDVQNFNHYIEKILKFIDLILNKVKFCLICITGKNSEDFAINLFNTLNTTGQPLTAFEVLKSELHTIDENLSKQINEIQSGVIKLHIFSRKKIVTHTGKLLLYLALYRGDFNEKNYSLSDNKFKDQRGYLKQVLNEKTASQLVEDIQYIDDFYSKKWLNLGDGLNLLRNDDEKICFQFLSELKHDRVLPVLIRLYKNNTKSLGQCVKICTAFSSLWRAYCGGGTSGIDKAYKDVSSRIQESKIENLNRSLKEIFLKKLSSESINQAKDRWIQEMKISTIYKNQKLSRFLLFLAYNKRHFDSDKNQLTKGSGIDILNAHYWKHPDYKTIEHIIPQSNHQIIGHTDALGNLTLLPQTLNSSLGNKLFSEKKREYQNFCSNNNKDKYPYLPIIKHITKYEEFDKTEIEERSKILSQFIWQTLAEDWLGWKK